MTQWRSILNSALCSNIDRFDCFSAEFFWCHTHNHVEENKLEKKVCSSERLSNGYFLNSRKFAENPRKRWDTIKIMAPIDSPSKVAPVKRFLVPRYRPRNWEGRVFLEVFKKLSNFIKWVIVTTGGSHEKVLKKSPTVTHFMDGRTSPIMVTHNWVTMVTHGHQGGGGGHRKPTMMVTHFMDEP